MNRQRDTASRSKSAVRRSDRRTFRDSNGTADSANAESHRQQTGHRHRRRRSRRYGSHLGSEAVLVAPACRQQRRSVSGPGNETARQHGAKRCW